MSDDLAEVTLPFAAGAGLRVAEAIRVESPRAIITADEFAWLTTNTALVLVTFRTTFLLARLQHVAVAVVVVIYHATSSRVEQTLLKHVESLHIHLFED